MKGEVHLIPGHPVMPVCTGEDCPVCKAKAEAAARFPFPLAPPVPPPAMVTRPCGCTSMMVEDVPVQVSWCDDHDPGAPAPEIAVKESGR